MIVYRNEKVTGYARGLYLFHGGAVASIPRPLFAFTDLLLMSFWVWYGIGMVKEGTGKFFLTTKGEFD